MSNVCKIHFAWEGLKRKQEILEQLKEKVRGCVTAHWKRHVRRLKVSG